MVRDGVFASMEVLLVFGTLTVLALFLLLDWWRCAPLSWSGPPCWHIPVSTGGRAIQMRTPGLPDMLYVALVLEVGGHTSPWPDISSSRAQFQKKAPLY